MLTYILLFCAWNFYASTFNFINAINNWERFPANRTNGKSKSSRISTSNKKTNPNQFEENKFLYIVSVFSFFSVVPSGDSHLRKEKNGLKTFVDGKKSFFFQWNCHSQLKNKHKNDSFLNAIMKTKLRLSYHAVAIALTQPTLILWFINSQIKSILGNCVASLSTILNWWTATKNTFDIFIVFKLMCHTQFFCV